MQKKIVDCSFSRPSPQSVKDGGYDGLARYLAWQPNSKVIQKDEYDLYMASGLSVTLVWEGPAQEAQKGFGYGATVGTEASRQAHKLGYPAGACIYYVLEDPNRVSTSQWLNIWAFLDGVRSTADPIYEIGGYGSQLLLEEAILRQKKIVKGWQVGGWSNSVSQFCHLYQRLGYVLNNTCDENACLQDDWGQAPRAVVEPIPQPKKIEENTLLWIVSVPGNPEWIITDMIEKAHVANPDAAKLILNQYKARSVPIVANATMDGPLELGPPAYSDADGKSLVAHVQGLLK